MKRDERKIRIVLVDNDPRAGDRVRAILGQMQDVQLVAQRAGAKRIRRALYP